jgi:uncharacterized protein (TIGR03437 family)
MRVLSSTLILLPLTAGLYAQTGTPVPDLAAFDQAMTNLMAKYKIPGGALAISQDGKLVFARGYGYADSTRKTPVQPDSMFRIASLSKPLTAVAILTLVQDKKLNLDDNAFDILSDLPAPAGTTPDPRLKKITVRQLLQHSGGWDFNSSPDPAFTPDGIAAALGTEAPASARDMVRYEMGEKLDFDPGTKFVYSNFGYTVLGRIIEKVSGMSYEQYVRTKLLLPAGVAGMRVGNTLAPGQLANEVHYYDTADPMVASVFPFITQQVAMPYGGWYLEGIDSNAGWIASPVDYLKFMNSIEGRRGPNVLLTQESINAMTAEPSTWPGTDHWYGMGFYMVNTHQAGQLDWWTDGVLEGTYAQVVRTFDGSDWVVMFNDWPNNDMSFGQSVSEALWSAYDSTTKWPAGDQFTNWPDATVAKPSITAAEGVLNAASFHRGIVPGSWIAIFGDALANNTRVWGSADIDGDNLPVALDGVSVTIGGKPAAISFISRNQINAQVPADLPAGAILVTVTNHGVSSTPVVAEVRAAAPALFSYGPGFVAAVHLDGTVVGDPAVVPGTRAAKPGETIELYGTGFAMSPAGVVIHTPRALDNPSFTLGTTTFQAQYAGLVAPGLFQINVVVPAVKAGTYTLKSKLGVTPFLGEPSLVVGN